MQGRVLLAATTGLAIGAAMLFDSQTPAQDGATPIPIEAPHVNRHSITIVMQAKLTNVRQALSGLIDQDFARIEKAARTLKLTSLRAPKLQSDDEIDDKVFEHFEVEFMRLAAKLEQLAQKRNLEGAAFVYENLTSTCIACHQHVRETAPVAESDR